MKNKSKGFTIVELVIVIAVVALLAAVLIPTFSNIIHRANISADTQLLRNMNVILAAGSSDGCPTSPEQVTSLLEENGVSKFKPKTKFHVFYWLRDENVIVLANGDDRAILPEEYSGASYSDGNWFDLKLAADLPAPPTEEFTPEGEAPQTFTVTLRKSGHSAGVDFDIPLTATEGKRYQATLSIPEGLKASHQLRKITVLMEDGDEEHEFVIRKEWESGSALTSHIDIPAVTGDITINVSIIEFCLVTITGDHVMGDGSYKIRCEKGMRLHISTNVLESRILEPGYMLTGASGRMNGADVGDIYDENNRTIYSRSLQITGDLNIEVTAAMKSYTVELVIRDTGEDIVNTEQKVDYPSERCTFNLSELLDGRDFTLNYKYLTATATENSLIPTCGYNEASGQLIVQNVKTDCKIVCHVSIAE